jgi:4-amino-4-deoxy-L-arabinose transferase-like glycosyltransferase
MWDIRDHRLGHYALLLGLGALLCLPGLGGPGLWDIDEGNNAGCSREMLEANNWLVPTINYQLREDKPVLLYWLQMAAYLVFGINEFSARLPSALATLLSLLAVYELGRRLLPPRAALLAGVILASTVGMIGAAHFANPDALLHACTVLTLLCFWGQYTRGGYWLVGAGIASGLGVLAKGPVGLVLPTAVACLVILWQRRMGLVKVRPVVLASLAFLLVALPWYIWVGVETKGQWLVGFFYRHNLERLTSPLENHSGPVFYYLLILLVGFAPWSIFLGPTVWHALRRLRRQGDDARPGVQLLVCWIAVYLVSFSIARTKLPNYILPLYPAVALLMAGFLDSWRRGEVVLPRWMPISGLVSLGLIGVSVSAGLLIASGRLPVPFRGQRLPELDRLAWIGSIPLVGAAVAGWCLARRQRGLMLTALSVTAAAFVGIAAVEGARVVDTYKAPRELIRALPPDQLEHDVRIAAFDYFQPSLLFYAQREIEQPEKLSSAWLFLGNPLPSYLVIPADTWEPLQLLLPIQFRILARHHDLYTNKDIVVVTNEGGVVRAAPHP